MRGSPIRVNYSSIYIYIYEVLVAGHSYPPPILSWYTFPLWSVSRPLGVSLGLRLVAFRIPRLLLACGSSSSVVFEVTYGRPNVVKVCNYHQQARFLSF